MIIIKQKFQNLSPGQLFLYLALFSLLTIAIKTINGLNSDINPDALVYLKGVINDNAITSSKENINSYHWPFFIYFLKSISLIFQNENIIKIIFIINSITTFLIYLITLVISYKIFKTKYLKNSLLITTIFFLTVNNLIDDYMLMIIRDLYGLLFFSISIYFYISFIDTQKLIIKTLSLITIFFAFLFRFEYLLFLVIFCFINVTKAKKISIDYKNIFILFACTFFIFLIVINTQYINNFDFYLTSFKKFFINLNNPLPINSNNEFIQGILVENTILFKYTFLICFFLKKILFNIGYSKILLLLASWRRFNYYKYGFKKSLYGNHFFLLLIASLIPCLINLFSQFVLTSRYLLPFNYISIFLFTSVVISLINEKSYQMYLKIFFFIVLIELVLIITPKNVNTPYQEMSDMIKNNPLYIEESVSICEDRINFYLHYKLNNEYHENCYMRDSNYIITSYSSIEDLRSDYYKFDTISAGNKTLNIFKKYD